MPGGAAAASIRGFRRPSGGDRSDGAVRAGSSIQPAAAGTWITPNPAPRLSASKSAGTSGTQRDALSYRRAAATRRAGLLPRPARERQWPLGLQRRLRLQVGSERSPEVQAVGSRFRDRPCSEHPQRVFRVAVPYELSADRCGSGKVSVFRTAGPAAEPNVGAVASAALNAPGSVVASPSMSIPDGKIVSTSWLSCRNQSLVPPHTSLRLMILAVMESASLVSLQLTVSSNVPLYRFPVFSSTASVSPTQSATSARVAWGSRQSAKVNVAKADGSQHGEVHLKSANQLSTQPAPPYCGDSAGTSPAPGAISSSSCDS